MNLTFLQIFKKRMLLCGLLILCFGESLLANTTKESIQEAIYRFEMKGERVEAIRILENAIANGNRDDKENASFYLAKIYELAGNLNLANFYYKQSLRLTENISKAYFLAEREAATSREYEPLLQKKYILKSDVKKIFKESVPYLLLQDNSIYKIQSDSLVRLPHKISLENDILKIDNQNIWYQNSARDSLFLLSVNNSKILKALPLPHTKDILSTSKHALVLGKNEITLVDEQGIKTQIKEQYNGCTIETFYRPLNHYILNCLDNSLHFINAETGKEEFPVSAFDAIRNVLVDKNELYFLAGNEIYSIQPQSKKNIQKWKIKVNNAASFLVFANYLAVLDATGKVHLINKKDGVLVRSLSSNASVLHILAKGTLGLFTSEGALSVLDTLLQPLWNYDFAKPLTNEILTSDTTLFLFLGKRYLQGISAQYYGKKELLSEYLTNQTAYLVNKNNWEKVPQILDSIFTLEPGNAKAWLIKALYLEKIKNKSSEVEREKAWAEAVRHSRNNPQVASYILEKYRETISAKFVNVLKISPQTTPQLFGNKKNLFTIDVAASKLYCINPETGEVRWEDNLPPMDQSPVKAVDENTLVLGSGMSLYVYDLNKKTSQTIPLTTGKAFNISLNENAIFVSTLNGFLHKIIKDAKELKPAYQRKIFPTHFYFDFVENEDEIVAVSADGQMTYLSKSSGLIKENGFNLPGGISQISIAENILAIATDNNRLNLFDMRHKNAEPIQIIMDVSINSLQAIRYRGASYFLVGFSNQQIALYSSAGMSLWKFEGKGSSFTEPFVNGDFAWLDQGNEVIALHLKNGEISMRFSTPSGSGTPFVMNKTLYSTSPIQLLYGFSLFN